jgi:hypothetical protein
MTSNRQAQDYYGTPLGQLETLLMSNYLDSLELLLRC